MSRSIVKPATIPEQLVALRTRYSVQELAYILGCSEQSVYHWSERRVSPRRVYRRMIEELYGKLKGGK